MKVDKLSVSFDPDLGDAVRVEALADFLDAWEAEHGSLTATELATAARQLSVPRPATTNPAA